MHRHLHLAFLVLPAILLATLPSHRAIGATPGAGNTGIVARGEYLANLGDCAGCHTVRGGAPYAGGLELPTPFGTLYTPNLTPDGDTGIGYWSADDFWRAMHEGRSKNGDYLYPAFPYTNYTKVTREDSDAIFAYLSSLRPVRQPNRENEMRFPYNLRELLVGWRTLFFRSGVYEPDPNESAQWNRGAYLIDGLGHCNACHGNRNILGAVEEGDVGGGLIPVQNWYAASLNSDAETGLGTRDVKEIVELLKTGISERAAVVGPMSTVVAHSLQYATAEDLTAMAVYLKTQAQKAPTAGPSQVRPGAANIVTLMKTGEKIYADMCVECHMDQGQGVPRIYPPLAGNLSILMDFPINPVRMILVGGFPPSTAGNPRPYGMPPFGHILNDEEVAAVVTYIRRSWGNTSSAVSHVEINDARGVPID